jgi:hypothetical protein
LVRAHDGDEVTTRAEAVDQAIHGQGDTVDLGRKRLGDDTHVVEVSAPPAASLVVHVDVSWGLSDHHREQAPWSVSASDRQQTP